MGAFPHSCGLCWGVHDMLGNVSLSLHVQGFVAAVSPFNFTAIGGNLAGAPALMVSLEGVGFL